MSVRNWKPETRRAYRARIKGMMRSDTGPGRFGADVYELESRRMWCLRPTASKPLLRKGWKP